MTAWWKIESGQNSRDDCEPQSSVWNNSWYFVLLERFFLLLLNFWFVTQPSGPDWCFNVGSDHIQHVYTPTWFTKCFRELYLDLPRCLSANWRLISFGWDVSLRLEEGTRRAFLYFQKRRKKEAYPTNVADLWVVACKPIFLAGNQSCSQWYEMVKCVTCQGSLQGVFVSGLVNKGYILGTRPSVALTKEEPNTQRLSFITGVPLFSFFLFFSEEMTWDQDQSTWKSGFSHVRCMCLVPQRYRRLFF